MDWVAIGTWALVAVTLALVGVTWWLARGQLGVAKEQLTVEIYLELRKEFDGPLITARKLLAQQLLENRPHYEINEPVLNFFEDVGMLIRRGYLEREMIWDTFSYYTTNWWSACKDYIAEERSNKGDTTLFTDFGDLVEQIYKDEMEERHKTRAELEPSPNELQRFLHEEARLFDASRDPVA